MKDLNYYLDLNYEIKLRKLTEEEGGGWLAEIPLLPGCISDGETPEEALANIEDAKKCWIETCLELGRSVPEPITGDFSGQLRIRIPKSLHRTLAERAKEEKVSLNQYISYQLARAEGHPTKANKQ
ncbi:MAG: type II toxin-antitoxin system HicB family antitoxin [Armatimonadetes bacterium]|nr:type II toxin-antitoxin system HicB family antitoxin [Armatimonadota bacterium]